MAGVPNGLRSTDKYCSVCGKHVTVLSHSTYLYKLKNPTRYMCSERCLKIEKGLIKMIRITDKYYVEVDTHFTVFELRTGKTGKETRVNATFHYGVEDALNEVIHRVTRDKLKTDEVIEIHKVLGLLRELKAEFIEANLSKVGRVHEPRRL